MNVSLAWWTEEQLDDRPSDSFRCSCALSDRWLYSIFERLMLNVVQNLIRLFDYIQVSRTHLFSLSLCCLENDFIF
jgi:hypothetical protein